MGFLFLFKTISPGQFYFMKPDYLLMSSLPSFPSFRWRVLLEIFKIEFY